MRRQTPVLQIVGLLFWLLATQGCTGPDLEKVARKQSTQSPKEASEGLRFAISEDPRSLEPGLSLLLQDSVIALNLHVGLFKYDRDSVLQPYLVREWSLSSDRLTYTFVLHDDWRWHNGRLISAADIKRDWERYLNPKLAAWGANYLTTIAGSPEMLRGTATELQGVQVVNANTLKVTLMRPDPLFLLRLGATPTWIAPPEAFVEGEPEWKNDPQGAGPFKFVQWQFHSRIVLQSNTGFRGLVPSLSRIEFLIVPDPTTALNMYRNDELDIAPVAANELQGVRHDQMLKNEIQYWPAAQVLFMGLNERKIAAFKDVRVRQSFAYAIDRETICNHVFFGAWAQALQLVPAGIPGHNVQSELTYDPERARRLIADAGFPGGRGFPAIELAVAGNTDSTAAEAIAAQLERNLSVKVYARPIEHGAFVAGLQGHHWDAFLVGWTADYLSAEQMLYRYLHHAEPMNFVDYYSPIFERVLDSAMHAKTVDAEETLLRKANQIATTEAALIPIAYGKFIFLVKPTVSGFAANLFEPMGFETVHKGRLSRE